MSIFKKKVVHVEETVTTTDVKEQTMESIALKNIGKLDMVVAFDTTGSMAAYIDAVRQEGICLNPSFV